MAHTHGHRHHRHDHDSDAGGGEKRLLFSVGLNLLITVAEIVGGILSGSLALLSDALHNLSDTLSLVVSFVARRISKRGANRRKTFGYKRAEIVGAFINLVTLLIIALFLVQKAVGRFVNPEPIDGPIMLAVAVVGLVANVLTAVLLHRLSKDNLNIKSAFLHIVSDGISSLGVVAGGLLILWYDFYLVDPILTVAVALYLVYHSYHMLRQTIDILMEGTPADVDLDEIVRAAEQVERVLGMHHVHVWQLDEQHTALEAHVLIDKDDLRHMERVKHAVKDLLEHRFGITHSTLEFEFVPCDPGTDPHCYEEVADQGVVAQE